MGKIISTSHATFDPYILGKSIRENREWYQGALLNTMASAPSTLGLTSVWHPDLGITTNSLKPEDLTEACRFFDGVDLNGKIEVLSALKNQPQAVTLAVRDACAASVQFEAWPQSLGKTALETTDQLHSANDHARAVGSLFHNPHPIGQLGPALAGKDSREVIASHAASAGMSHVIETFVASDASLSGCASHLTERAHLLSRLILGCYDFYALHHDESTPYLVTPEVAVKASLKPAFSATASRGLSSFLGSICAQYPELARYAPDHGAMELPNPWFAPGAAIASNASQAAGIRPCFRHPTLSQDYGSISNGPLQWASETVGTPLYRLTSLISAPNILQAKPLVTAGSAFISQPEDMGADAHSDALERIDATQDRFVASATSGMGDGHLCHTSWIASRSLESLLSDPNSGLTLDRSPASAPFLNGMLPMDQVYTCASISTHGHEMALIEAAKALNPISLISLAHLAGVDRSVIERFADSWASINGSPSTQNSTGPEQFTRATYDLLRSSVRKHATNVMARHPEMLDPCVGMRIVVRPSDLEIDGMYGSTSSVGVSWKRGTLVPNLVLADIELPTGPGAEYFANSPSVKAGLGDRIPQEMVRASKESGKPFFRGGAMQVLGCPFVSAEEVKAAEGKTATDYVMPSDPRRSQVVCALDYFSRLHPGQTRPFAFLSSLFEVNTRTDEYIKYQDEFTQYLNDLSTGKEPSVPRSSPFQLVPLTFWEAKFTAIDGSGGLISSVVSEQVSGKDAHKSPNYLYTPDPSDVIDRMNGGRGTTTIDLAVKGFGAPYLMSAALAIKHDTELKATLAKGMQPSRVDAPDMNSVIESLHRAHALAGHESVLTPDFARNTANYLRFLRAVKCNIGGGVVTGQGLKDLVSTRRISRLLEKNVHDASMVPPLEMLGNIAYAAGVTKTRMGALRAAFSMAAYNCFAYDHKVDGVFSFRDDSQVGAMLDNAYSQALDAVQQLKDDQEFAPMISLQPIKQGVLDRGNFFTLYGLDSPFPIPKELKETFRQSVKELDPSMTPGNVPILNLVKLPDVDDLAPGGSKTYAKSNPFANQAKKTGFDLRSIMLDCPSSMPLTHWNNLTRHGAGPLMSNSVNYPSPFARRSAIKSDESPGKTVAQYSFTDTLSNQTEPYIKSIDDALRKVSLRETGQDMGLAEHADIRALVGVPHFSASPMVLTEKSRQNGKLGRVVVALGAFATAAKGDAPNRLREIKMHHDLVTSLSPSQNEVRTQSRSKRRV